MYQRIRALRKSAGRTQAEVAAYLGCHQQTYSRYETGQVRPPLKIFIKLALYYHTSIDYLLELTDQREPNPELRSKQAEK